MEPPETPIPEPPPAAPPIVPGPLDRRAQTSWPTVIGTISIVLGALGVVGGGCGVIGTLAGGWMMAAVPTDEVDPDLMMPAGMMAAAAASNMANALVAVVLLAAGIGLVNRRRWGPRAAIAWSWTRIVVSLAGAVLLYFVQRAQMEAAMAADAQSGAPAPPFAAWIVTAAPIIGFGLGLAWAWAFPVFMLVWFSRRKVRDEISSWR